MKILTDYYIWFIISGLIILLITIGYYAEKTGFGKTKLSKSDEKVNSLDSITTGMQDIIANDRPIMEVASVQKEDKNNIPDDIVIIDSPTLSSENTFNDNSKNITTSTDVFMSDSSAPAKQPTIPTNNSKDDIWKF